MKNANGLLTIKNLVKHFDISGGLLDQLSIEQKRIVRRRTTVKALNDVSLWINPRETLGVVGESGCGKSTLARTVLGLYPPNSGEIYYKDKRIDNLNPQRMLPYRKKMQMIFQDPYASLNPRMTVKKTLEEPITFHFRSITSRKIQDKVAEVMQQVGVEPSWATRYPHEFSGGQRQRISIARALMVDPEFIVADEPVSALDVSIQAQILNLLMDAQEKRGLTYMLITHDLSVVEHVSTRAVNWPSPRSCLKHHGIPTHKPC
jgi:peptide/nickel transport system ATP-binding protein